jgi:Flp pilus assembly pilin Flp
MVSFTRHQDVLWMSHSFQGGTPMVFAQAYLTSLVSLVSDRLALARSRAHTGQGLVEYALIIAAVAIAAIVVLGVLSGQINKTFTSISSSLPNLAPTPTP